MSVVTMPVGLPLSGSPYSAGGPDLQRPTLGPLAHIFGPGSIEVRYLTGKDERAVLIQSEGRYVAVLYPRHIEAILRAWLQS